jgi:hypothetical protein
VPEGGFELRGHALRLSFTVHATSELLVMRAQPWRRELHQFDHLSAIKSH